MLSNVMFGAQLFRELSCHLSGQILIIILNKLALFFLSSSFTEHGTLANHCWDAR